MTSFLFRLYENCVLKNPKTALAVALLFTAVLGIQIPNFKLDASADSLVLENDDDLRYHRKIGKIYGSEDFLVVTYAPFGDLLSDSSLEGLRELRDDFLKMERVKSVASILDVPLLNSPKVTFKELSNGVRTLETPGVDKELARKEFLSSPIYRNMLTSVDGKTTALQINFKRDEKYFSLLNARNRLREKKVSEALSSQEEEELETASVKFKEYLAQVLDYESREIEQVRAVMDRQRDHAQMFLGGVPMITADMVGYIENDIEKFGGGVLLFMLAVLYLFFRKVRWVALPLLCCAVNALAMVGYLGWLDWRVTVISSNFLSILIIITMQLTIHLVVRFNELQASNPGESSFFLAKETVLFMFQPCFYTAITTMVAFSSLVVSGIRPVIDFGWMMTIGITMGFILAFVVLPACMVLLAPDTPDSTEDSTRTLTMGVARFTHERKTGVLLGGVAVGLFSLAGISQLNVENRFIDNFKTHTEIYQGMEVIDRQLGGTTPLALIVNPPAKYFEDVEKQKMEKEVFDDPFAEEEEDEEPNYWFHAGPLNRLEKIHDHLESLPEIGKALSIATTMKIIKLINDGEMPDDYDLALIRKLLPDEVNRTMVKPYLSDDANQVRMTMRIVEAEPTLKRKDLIEKIRKFLVEEMKIPEDRFRFTGMAILYNNMLYSLYGSQIQTLGFVFVAILIMFAILFRNVRLAGLAIIPNILAAGLVLGIMGVFGIPLDMMTITIAAIAIGIAVDDTIHYIHRFKEEFAKDSDYRSCVDRCHGSIGRAIYYTSITVTFGFSILALSNFIPTIYFGLLTGLAMVVALGNNLTLLAALILHFKPLGPARQAPGGGSCDV